MKITVIGSISTDIVVEATVAPAVGETIQGDKLSFSFGGKGANQAVAVARLGVETEMIGSVGNDVFGNQLIENLENNSIKTENVKQVDQSSGTAIIQLIQGDNSIIYIPGANNELTVKDIENAKSTLQESQLVIIQNEVKAEVVQNTIDLCMELNTPLLYNPAPARQLSEDYIKKVTYLTPNETEFKVLFPNQKMEDVLAKYPNKLVVTLGDKGAAYHNGVEVKMVPSFKVDKVIDTTGAGDCFNGAFAVATVKGLTIDQAIKFANLASSIAIQRFGAQSGNPTLKEIKEHQFYEKTWNFE
ncbi:ribokinase [Globicatella sanguinis]|uniref:ribokinase n=1 Tax=Globicatella sanguinis TaxID=13076 RepID=UPI002542E9A5|nr:ribokinase [Globicatella sanguinis]MDK7630937.1 ribokinase [Globicatella sanguinis]WIK67417.1 ribokinase [Globicatella sanguinis]WKT56822.1 ribokinase [Globicatella sanguinis]